MTKTKPGLLERDSFYILLMTVIIIGFFGRILFTDQIIRASDVITQFFWGAKAAKDQTFLQFLQGIPAIFHAGWDPLSDGGRTLEGGWNAINLLFHRYLIQHFFPFPSSRNPISFQTAQPTFRLKSGCKCLNLYLQFQIILKNIFEIFLSLENNFALASVNELRALNLLKNFFLTSMRPGGE